MKIGAALVLLAVGAILRFAVMTNSTHGISVHTVGDILMIVGAIGLILWFIVWGPWRSRRSGYPGQPAYSERRVYTERQVPEGEPPAVYRRDERY